MDKGDQHVLSRAQRYHIFAVGCEKRRKGGDVSGAPVRLRRRRRQLNVLRRRLVEEKKLSDRKWLQLQENVTDVISRR
ncbi:hypothetical protein H920_17468 [Fukomys damarensis]|uniref:Uncharacterized protein n=1 Tax=Fukomys damarensis TaxID=885580 RepID=A0A091CU51_FUKDA|nr:hypothetical protein H920_17468 [Fukomys damarensis]